MGGAGARGARGWRGGVLRLRGEGWEVSSEEVGMGVARLDGMSGIKAKRRGRLEKCMLGGWRERLSFVE